MLTEIYVKDWLAKVFYFSLKKTGNREDAEELAADISLTVLSLSRETRRPNTSRHGSGQSRREDSPDGAQKGTPSARTLYTVTT